MMQKKTILFVLLMLAASAVKAYDFSATVASGQTLYFNYVVGGVEVTHPSDKSGYANAWSGYTKPEGDLTVPTYVSDGDSTYSVRRVGKVAFYGCSGLTSVVVSQGVTALDDYAFSFCSSVATVELPSSLLSVGNQSLANLTALTDLWCAAAYVPATHTYTFYGTELSECTLHVECESVDKYEADDLWGGFGTVDEADCKATLTVLAGNSSYGATSGSGTYDVGTLVTISATAYSGYKFTCWNDAGTQNPRVVTLTADTVFTAVFTPQEADTVVVTDTVVVIQHDTLLLADTVYVAVPVHDTAYVHDTLYVAVPTHDTVYHTDTIVQTITLHDTVMPTFFNVNVLSNNAQLGVGVGTALLPAGIEAEVCGLPIEGGRFLSWDDGSTQNPRRITITGALTLTALFEQVAIAEAEAPQWTCHLTGRRLTVEGAAGRTVTLYDAQGRRLMTQPDVDNALTVELPVAGLYLLQVGDGAARKIIAN